jgi:2-phosphosulfolactate phosphatase
MKVYIKSGLHGAKTARGTGVIIDVFRASSTICAILACGARCILPVRFLKEALELKKSYPNLLVIGERRGLRPTGFDYGNSPYDMSRLCLRNRTVIFRSSAGSRAILDARKACAGALLIGGFVNAGGIVRYIKDKEPKEVSLIAVGTVGLGVFRKAVEDQLCAQYIKDLLEDVNTDFGKIKTRIQTGEGAKRLIELGQTKDLEVSLRLDLYAKIVPRAIFDHGCIAVF